MPINPKLVHVYQLLDPIEARPNGAWVIQYHGESFLTDPGGGNPEPFAWADQPHQAVAFDVKTREEIAGQLRINPAKVGIVQRTDATFPAPISASAMARSGRRRPSSAGHRRSLQIRLGTGACRAADAAQLPLRRHGRRRRPLNTCTASASARAWESAPGLPRRPVLARVSGSGSAWVSR